MDYEELRREYPESISMEQMYRICHISKRKALWLLENGIIPCKDSGKQTRRFCIRLEDVIDFLRRRDAGESEEMIPSGIFSSGVYPVPVSKEYLDSGLLSSTFLERWKDAPDMLTVKQAALLCGYGTTSINRWFAHGKLKGINYYGSNLVSKESLADYLASPAGQSIAVKSDFHRSVMEEVRRREDMDVGISPMSMSF